MEVLKLTPKEFEQVAKLVYDKTGIHLPESKLSLLSNRLRQRLRALNLSDFDAYYKLLCNASKCKEELPEFLSAVTTNETYFFRNEKLWKYIRGTWIPRTLEKKKNRSSKRIRIWSAACSSGEEAYTTAICLREDVSNCSSWNISIIGSDISERVLGKAREGKYNDYAVAKILQDQRKRWFDESDGVFQLKAELRKLVTFQTHNLRDRFPNGNFDLVFLRNVLMYFDTPMKLRVLDTVTNALVPGGHLIVGDVDPIRQTAELNAALKLNYCGPNLYQKPEQSHKPALAEARN